MAPVATRPCATALPILLALLAGPPPAAADVDATAANATGEQVVEIVVPVDHDRPAAGTWTLICLLAGPFDATRPTVFAVADGQQFFIRPGRVAQVAARTCGGDVNVVGIPGRIISDELVALVTGDDGSVDWPQAARVFGSRQWCGDIDAVRRHLLGEDARILITGGSGGGMLVQEYLTRYGEHCARAALVEAIGRGDRKTLDGACERYQVDAVHALVSGGEGVAVAVRMFEFYWPALAAVDPDGPRFHPTLEMAAALARPLFEAHAAGAIPTPEFAVDRLAAVDAEVFLLAGRWDQPVDWRTQQDLATILPRSELFLADDDHLFKDLEAAGLRAALRDAFLLSGPGSAELDGVLARCEPHRWSP